ncbi:MAG: PTS sugar transporter subunit IIA [Gemmatimonadales bacterium]
MRGVVAAHGALAEALVRAAESISGVTGALRPVSNEDCDRGRLEARLAEAIGPGPAVVFVDLPSGSCHFAALHRYHEDPRVRVITGVNLAMLVDFVFHRELPLEEAVAKALTAGTRAIKVP